MSVVTSPLEAAYAPLGPRDCWDVVVLHRASFAEQHLRCTIFASDRVQRYLASLVAFPSLQDEHVLYGARCGRQLVGYAHFRALPESWHLNNIAVAPTWRRQGIGSRLWAQWLELGHSRGYRTATLDAKPDNIEALQWYRRQRFEEVSTTWVYAKDLPETSPPLTGCCPALLDWDSAEAWQTAYGFSRFRLRHGQREWTIGRLGDIWFRTTAALPLCLEQALRLLDHARRLLILSPEPLTGQGLTHIGRSIRMERQI